MTRFHKLVKILTHILCLMLINFIISRKSLDPILVRKLDRFATDIRHVLLWNDVHGIEDNGQKQFIDKKCDNYNCYITKNRSLFDDIRFFDAVVFNAQDVNRGDFELPKVRSVHQKYIFAANDSADNYPVCERFFDDFFNWTWTYKRDSTIAYRFVNVFNEHLQNLGNNFRWTKPIHDRNSIKKELLQKSKAAAIFLDECDSNSGREYFIKALEKELAKYQMTIDVFGKCGSLECKRKTMKPCFIKLRKYYYFYLALEDSMATDFVTNIVLYAYQNNAVPVVLGKADYSKFLPPDSYIDAVALGVQKLAQVMHKVSYDKILYSRYFNWKDYYTLKESEGLSPCDLCEALNKKYWLTEESVYKEFRKWWNEEPCKSDNFLGL